MITAVMDEAVRLRAEALLVLGTRSESITNCGSWSEEPAGQACAPPVDAGARSGRESERGHQRSARAAPPPGGRARIRPSTTSLCTNNLEGPATPRIRTARARVVTRRSRGMAAGARRLIGRDEDAEHVLAALLSGRKLITLHGPGGIGKTSLAVEVADRSRRTKPRSPGSSTSARVAGCSSRPRWSSALRSDTRHG